MLGLKNQEMTPEQCRMFKEHTKHALMIGRSLRKHSFFLGDIGDFDSYSLIGLWRACVSWHPGKGCAPKGWVTYVVRAAVVELYYLDSRWFARAPIEGEHRRNFRQPPTRIGLSLRNEPGVVWGRHEGTEDCAEDQAQSGEEFERLVGLAPEESRGLLRAVFRDGKTRYGAGRAEGLSDSGAKRRIDAALRVIRSKIEDDGATKPWYTQAATNSVAA